LKYVKKIKIYVSWNEYLIIKQNVLKKLSKCYNNLLNLHIDSESFHLLISSINDCQDNIYNNDGEKIDMIQ